MDLWLDAAGRFFNPKPEVRVVPLAPGQVCCVVDGVLANPEGVVAWAAAQAFRPPQGYPYPGLVAEVPPSWPTLLADFFAQHARAALGARRTLDQLLRLSLVTLAPDRLQPWQWQCHRDRVSDAADILFAASVLYLFRDPALGGTSFYRPRGTAAQTAQLIEDSQELDAASFAARHGVVPGYMADSNAHFERVAQVPAAWNRAIFYDGGLFHSADVGQSGWRSADPRRGRLTLNSFFTCRRRAA